MKLSKLALTISASAVVLSAIVLGREGGGDARQQSVVHRRTEPFSPSDGLGESFVECCWRNRCRSVGPPSGRRVSWRLLGR